MATPKVQDDSGTKPEGNAATDAATHSNESGERRRMWDDQIHRVKAAVWRHPQTKNRMRYTTAIYRSYRSDDGDWHNVHFFDEGDLDDVIAQVQAAKAAIARLKGLGS